MIRLKKNSTFKSGLVLGIGLGLASGILSASLKQKEQALHADKILDNVKKAFLKEGPIEGGWIQYEKQPFQKFAIKTDSYLGGINRLEDDKIVTYEFLADANTGAILELNRL